MFEAIINRRLFLDNKADFMENRTARNMSAAITKLLNTKTTVDTDQAIDTIASLQNIVPSTPFRKIPEAGRHAFPQRPHPA